MSYLLDDTIEELANKTPVQYIDELLKKEERDFTKHCINQLGFTEKKGLQGQIMLYPIQGKSKKIERDELNSLVTRLYKVTPKESELIHLNDRTKKECEETLRKSLKNNKLTRKSHKRTTSSISASMNSSSKALF